MFTGINKRITSLLIFWSYWIIFFLSARLIFILFQFSNASAAGIIGIFSSFFHGMALDISTIGYYSVIPVLLSLPALYISGNWFRYFMRWYSYFLIFLSLLLVIADAVVYPYWGFRIDYSVFIYLKTPKEAVASVSTLKLVSIILLVITLVSLFVFLYRKFVDAWFSDFLKVKSPFKWTAGMLLLLGSLIVPIRGGVGIAPINAGSVYFSSNMFLNHAALNAVWNVGTTALTRKPVSNPYKSCDDKTAEQIFTELNLKGRDRIMVLNNEKPNVLFLILESFSGYLVGPIGGDSLVTPNLNRYCREGILFSSFYASGTRTDKAMPAILNGYPAQPAQSIIKEPKKTQSLPGLVKIFNDHGYRSSFWYGGEINFANFNSYVIGSGFHDLVTMKDFNSRDYNSKWGVHDHIMFNALKDSMQAMKEPFFRVVLTLSSHEPFDVPMEPVFKGNDVMTKYKNSVHYADKALGGFLDWAKTTEWWKNTLIIMVADHCARTSVDIQAGTRQLFKIPMVWTGGALAKESLVVDKTGGQTDIAETLINQLRFDGNFPFSKDMLSPQTSSFAFYTYNEGFGFVTDSSSVVYDHKSGGIIEKSGKDPSSAETIGKAWLQVLFNDYLKR